MNLGFKMFLWVLIMAVLKGFESKKDYQKFRMSNKLGQAVT